MNSLLPDEEEKVLKGLSNYSVGREYIDHPLPTELLEQNWKMYAGSLRITL